MDGAISMKLLKDLFDQCREDDENSDSDVEDAAETKCSSNSKMKIKATEKTENSLLKKVVTQETIPKSMAEWELLNESKNQELLEHRKMPNYSITYKQSVTTEDLFLQMGLKTPATSSCEDMIIQIELPEETVKINEMDLKVLTDQIDLQTPVYRFKLDLPHKVNPNKSKAEYDSDKKILKLCMRLCRELDFVNF